MDNPVSNFVQEKASDVVGFFAERTAEEQVKFPALVGAAFLKKYNDENGTFPPPQFKDAAAHLKEVIRKYPNAKIDLYGHSLGSMNIQYALACLTEEEASHIGTVHLYNGPNAYPILTPEQKARIDSLKYKIYNHIDHKDLVSLGYQDSGSKESSGIVKHLKTKNLINTGLQHMMHGYIYDKDGNLVLEKGTEAITRKEIIEERMKVYYRLKDKLQKTGGGLSSSEQIYLDALQARLASDELIRVVDEGLEQAQKSKARLDTDLEALEKVLQTVPKGFILNLSEVEEAYAQAGATRQTVVTQVRERFDNRLAAYQSLSNEFHALNEQVNTGIELLKAKDQKIAGEMNQWEQLALLISSTLSKKEKKLDHLEREFQKARLELDEKRCLVEGNSSSSPRCWKKSAAMAASFLQEQEVDNSCGWESLHRCIEEYDIEAREAAQVALKQIEIEEENLWQSYRKERRQLEEEIAQDKVSSYRRRKYG